MVNKYGDRWWREVILLSLALDNPPIIEPFLKAIIPTENFKTDIGLVMDSLKDSLIKPQSPILEALENKGLASETKANAIRLLSGIGGPRVIDALKRMVPSRDKTIALAAYEALAALGEADDIVRPIPELPGTIISPKDQSPMVLIPAGTFMYGSRDDDKMAASAEKPQRLVNLPAFYMDAFPVTNRQYAAFLNDQVPGERILDEWIYLKDRWTKERCRINQKGKGYEVEKGFDMHPVIFVSWYGAKAYAEWAEKRLPTEQEWEKAARGTDGRNYPWGNGFNKDLCNTSESNIEKTTPVDAYSMGKSPYGCYDMAGNVWEWTASFYDRKKDARVLRGGSWLLGSGFSRCAARDSSRPGNRDTLVGFRCART